MNRNIVILLILLPSIVWPVNRHFGIADKSLSVADCSINNTAFGDNEHLVYQIYYNWGLIWLNVGQAVFHVNETKDGYYINAVGDTYSSYEWLFNVYDQFEVMVDKSTLMPKWSVKKVRENGYKRYEKKIFNQEGKSVMSYAGPDINHLTKKTVSVNECTQDILSALYFVRNYQFQNYSKGKSFDLNIFMDDRNYYLPARFDGFFNHKDVKALGTFNTIRLSPATVPGQVFSSASGSHIYASNDANKIPLMIEAKLTVGSIKVILQSAKNLRNPFISRVK